MTPATRHRLILRLSKRGLTAIQVAKRVHCSAQTVYNVRRRANGHVPTPRRHIDRRLDSVDKRLDEAIAAVEKRLSELQAARQLISQL